MNVTALSTEVLFVDDEPDVLSSLKRQFRKAAFGVRTAGSAAEAIAELERKPAPVVVTDERMPGMSGVELLRRVKERWPDTVRVMLSGYAEPGEVIAAMQEGTIYRYLTKPWLAADLSQTLDEALLHHRVLRRNRDFMRHLLAEAGDLGRQVAGRDGSVVILHRTIDCLDYPVIAIGEGDAIGLANDRAREVFGSLCEDHASLAGILPDQAITAIENALRIPGGQGLVTVGGEDHLLTILVRSLRPTDPYRGLLIVDELMNAATEDHCHADIV